MRYYHLWSAKHVRLLLLFIDARLNLSNVSEQLIERGLATVLRHRRDDEDRSAELDKLIAAEQRQVPSSVSRHALIEKSN